MAKRRSKSRSRSRSKRSGSRKSSGGGGTDLGAKVLLALIMGLLFFILSNQKVYDATNSLLNKITNKNVTEQNQGGTPSTSGNAIHAVVYALLTFLLLEIL